MMSNTRSWCPMQWHNVQWSCCSVNESVICHPYGSWQCIPINLNDRRTPYCWTIHPKKNATSEDEFLNYKFHCYKHPKIKSITWCPMQCHDWCPRQWHDVRMKCMCVRTCKCTVLSETTIMHFISFSSTQNNATTAISTMMGNPVLWKQHLKFDVVFHIA